MKKINLRFSTCVCIKNEAIMTLPVKNKRPVTMSLHTRPRPLHERVMSERTKSRKVHVITRNHVCPLKPKTFFSGVAYSLNTLVNETSMKREERQKKVLRLDHLSPHETCNRECIFGIPNFYTIGIECNFNELLTIKCIFVFVFVSAVMREHEFQM